LQHLQAKLKAMLLGPSVKKVGMLGMEKFKESF